MTKQRSIDFGQVAMKLDAYVEATAGDFSKYVRRAVNEHIDLELERNLGTKERFDRIFAALLADAGGNVTRIPAKRGRKPKNRIGESNSENG